MSKGDAIYSLNNWETETARNVSANLQEATFSIQPTVADICGQIRPEGINLRGSLA